ncbi:MBL fold metallo-hydrolase [Candidatus Auribacterota bacterium]
MLRICVLGSGSRGNSIYIGVNNTHLLIDVGLSCKEMEKRLAEIGVSPEEINGILISHEHIDHIKGIPLLSSKFNIPVFSNRLTAGKIKENIKNGVQKNLRLNIFLGGNIFEVNALEVKPFSVFHDAIDPVGFIVSYKDKKIAVATDLGFPSSLVKERLKGVDAIILESNYDIEMLKNSKRPWSLKQRIMGRQGHLSNIVAANLLADVMHDDLQEIFLVHLSQDCNSPDLALKTTREKVLNKSYQGNLRMTYQKSVSELVAL